jgi:hypothetical protein
MNEAKVRSEIEKLTEQNRYRQYPLSKAQRARLEELGILHLMPERFLGHGQYGPGYTDAAVVIAAAEDAGGREVVGNGYDDEADTIRRRPSALWLALHEPEPQPEPEPDAEPDDTPDDEDDEIYSYDPADEALDRLADEIADIEQREFEARELPLVEAELAEEAALDDLHPLSHFAHLAPHSTLRRAAREGRLQAEKIGRDWFTSEREVRRYLAKHPSRPRRKS